MKYYQTKTKIFKGNNYRVAYKLAWQLFVKIKNHTKRRPYVRSKYFNKDKIFFDYFWMHLKQKNKTDRLRRLSVFICAIDLIINSMHKPHISINRNKMTENLYQFFGQDMHAKKYIVQIKENKKTGTKYFMSCFPEK